MQDIKHQQVKHYNKSSRNLPKLKTGDAVYIQLVPKARNWEWGMVTKIPSSRTYKVKTNVGGVYVRN